MAVGVLTGVVIALAFAYPGRRMRSSADQIAARGPMVRCATIGGVSSIGQCNTSRSLLPGVSKAKVFRGR